jgi:signal transduction histidine kinase
MSSESSPDPDRAWLSTLTVLYVEDDELTRAALAEFLRRRVRRLIQGRDGREGLARFNEERPALVLTDIRMAGMDGLTMAEEIRRVDARVPIIVTTAFEQVSYLARAIDLGVDKFVTKPVDLDKLEAALLSCARRLRGEAAVARERERELHAARTHEREVVGLFAGGMAHDFNNLLQSILGNIAIACELAPRQSEQSEVLDDARCSAEQAGQLGGRLLALAENSFGRSAGSGALGPVLQGAVTEALSGSRIELRLHLPEDLPPVWHDDHLGQAFGNLARNAREAMRDEGALHIDVALRDLGEGELDELRQGRYLQVTFRDGGPGIAPDVLPKVFDPYFSTKPRGTVRGMGLGLSLCLAIVRQHRGEVTAASLPGAGAVFTVLPPTFGPEAKAHG